MDTAESGGEETEELDLEASRSRYIGSQYHWLIKGVDGAAIPRKLVTNRGFWCCIDPQHCLAVRIKINEGDCAPNGVRLKVFGIFKKPI